MANAFSTLRQYGEYIQPYNFDLIQKGLEYKQQKFDVNMFKIQTEIDKIGDIDLARDVDKEYLYNRLQKLVDNTNSFGSMDLSSDGITRNIVGHISQAQDENVVNAIIDTKAYRDKVNTINTIREKHPDKYSDVNAMEAMEGLNNWVSSGEVGDRLKASEYTPYVDVQAKQQKVLKDLMSDTEREFQLPVYDVNGNQIVGALKTVKVKGMTKSEINSIIDYSLSPQDRKQLQINGKWMYRKNIGSENTFELFNNNIHKDIEHYDSLLKDGKLSKAEVTNVKKQLIALNDFKDSLMPSLKDSEEIINSKADRIGSYLERTKLTNGMYSMYHDRKVSDLISSDKVYFDKLNYALKLRAQNFKESKSSTNSTNGGNNAMNNGLISITKQREDVPVVLPIEKEYDNIKVEKDNALQSATDKVFQTLDSSTKDTFSKTAKVMAAQDGEMTEQQALSQILKSYVSNKDTNEIDSEIYADFKLKLKDVDKLNNIYIEAHQKGVGKVGEYLSTLHDNIRETLNYRIRNRYNKVLDFDVSKKDLTTVEKEKLNKVIAADYIIGYEQDMGRAVGNTPQATKYLYYLADKFNEFPTNVEDAYRIDDIKGAPKTIEFINNTMKQGVGDKSLIGTDVSIVTDSKDYDLSKSYKDEFKNTLRENIGYFQDKVNFNIVPASSIKEFNSNAPLVKSRNIFASLLTDSETQTLSSNNEDSTPSFDMKKGVTINMNVTPSMSLMINGDTKMLVRTDVLKREFGDEIGQLNTTDEGSKFIPEMEVKDINIPKPMIGINVPQKRKSYIENEYKNNTLAIKSVDKSEWIDLFQGVKEYGNSKETLNNTGQRFKNIIDNIGDTKLDIVQDKFSNKAVATIYKDDKPILTYNINLPNSRDNIVNVMKQLNKQAIEVPNLFLLKGLLDVNFNKGNNDEILKNIENIINGKQQ